MTHANHIQPAALPSKTRYKTLSRQTKKISLTRALQYEILAKQSTSGKLLDVGGGNSATYRDLLNCKTYHAINIDPAVQPTWVVGIREPWQAKTNEYDVVLSLNTFEHVFDAAFLLKEIYRTLRSGGQTIIAVPFLHPIHAHPDDYFRPTPSWFSESMTDIGYKNIEINPLAWGPFTTGFAASGAPGPGKKTRLKAAMLTDLLYAKLHSLRGTSETYQGILLRHALAFFVKAEK